MGMFDSFILNEPVKCPRCGKGELIWFQTKALGCDLYEYKQQGDVIKLYGLRVSSGSVEVYDWCKECKIMIYGDARIEDGVFIDIVNLRWDYED